MQPMSSYIASLNLPQPPTVQIPGQRYDYEYSLGSPSDRWASPAVDANELKLRSLEQQRGSILTWAPCSRLTAHERELQGTRGKEIDHTWRMSESRKVHTSTDVRVQDRLRDSDDSELRSATAYIYIARGMSGSRRPWPDNEMGLQKVK